VQFRHAAGVRVFFLQQRLQRQCANLVWSRGRRVDWALTPNIFLRAEFEWDAFNAPPGLLYTLATGRVGAGFKF
jgi:hypothetical protein